MEEYMEDNYDDLVECASGDLVDSLKMFEEEWNEHSFDLNYRIEDGMTFLMFACDNLYYDMIKFLLDHDADISLKDSEGYTAIFHLLIAYTRIIEQIAVTVDDAYMVSEINFIRDKHSGDIRDYLNRNIRRFSVVDKIYNNILPSSITEEHRMDVIISIINGTFDGYIPEFKSTLDLFFERQDIDSLNLKKECIDLFIPFDRGMHFAHSFPEIQFTALEYLIKLGLKVDNIEDYPEDVQPFIEKWIDGHFGRHCILRLIDALS